MISPTVSPLSGSLERARIPRWMRIMGLLWTLLALRVGCAVKMGVSLAGDLALPTFALFAVTAVLGSGVYSIRLDRAEARARRAGTSSKSDADSLAGLQAPREIDRARM